MLRRGAARDELAVGWRAALAFGERRQDALGAGRRNDSPLRKRVPIDSLPSVEPDRMRRAQAFELGRLLTAWGTVIAFLAFGGAWLADLDPALKAAVLFVWVFSIIMWCVFGVVRHADALAELLGEPLGTRSEEHTSELQ